MTKMNLDSRPCRDSFEMVAVRELLVSDYVPGAPLIASLLDERSGVRLTVDVRGNESVGSFLRRGRIGLNVWLVERVYEAPLADGGVIRVQLLEDGSRMTTADVPESSTLWSLTPPPPVADGPAEADRTFTVTVDVPSGLLDPEGAPTVAVQWTVDPVVGGAVSNASTQARSDAWYTKSAWPFVEVTNGGGTVFVNGAEYGAGYVRGPNFTVTLGKLYKKAKYVTYDVTAAF